MQLDLHPQQQRPMKKFGLGAEAVSPGCTHCSSEKAVSGSVWWLTFLSRVLPCVLLCCAVLTCVCVAVKGLAV